MKIAVMMVGLLIEGDDDLTADVLMNYAMNSLNLKNDSGILRHVEVRELKIPSIVDKRTDDNQDRPDFHLGPVM